MKYITFLTYLKNLALIFKSFFSFSNHNLYTDKQRYMNFRKGLISQAYRSYCFFKEFMCGVGCLALNCLLRMWSKLDPVSIYEAE